MDFRQLEAFVSTVEHKSFSAAAAALYLSQPTISSHVHSLEKELQVQLIHRTTKRFEVTSEGQRLYEYAVALLQHQKKAINELSDAPKKELHIGASSVPGQCILPQILGNYRQLCPDVCFQVVFSDSLDIIQQVSNGTLDIGLVGTTAESRCAFVPFVSDELVVAVPNTPHYQELISSGTPLSQLLKEPIIMRTDHSGTMRETQQFLQSLQISMDDLNIIAYMNDAAAIQNCVIQGLGVSIMSRQTVEASAQRGDLLMVPLGEHALLRKLYIVYRESEFLPRTSLDFIRFFAEQFPEAASCTALLP